MSIERPGRAKYVTATKVTPHETLCTENNLVGTAIKQKAAGWGDAFTATPTIAIGEQFIIRDKGICQTPIVGSPTQGSTVWINKTNNAITLTDPGSGNGLKVGRVVELPGSNRGVPAGFMRVDLDNKDSF